MTEKSKSSPTPVCVVLSGVSTRMGVGGRRGRRRNRAKLNRNGNWRVTYFTMGRLTLEESSELRQLLAETPSFRPSYAADARRVELKPQGPQRRSRVWSDVAGGGFK